MHEIGPTITCMPALAADCWQGLHMEQQLPGLRARGRAGSVRPMPLCPAPRVPWHDPQGMTYLPPIPPADSGSFSSPLAMDCLWVSLAAS